MKAILASIPYVELHDLDLNEAGVGTARLGMAMRPDMTDHVGIPHAGARYTLAETTAGVAGVARAHLEVEVTVTTNPGEVLLEGSSDHAQRPRC